MTHLSMTDHILAMITAWAAVIASLAAATTVFISWRGIVEQNLQAKASREDFKLSLAADLSMKLEDRFNANEHRKIRSRAARALVTNTDLVEAEEVFDFFEMVGLLVQSGAVTNELAYNFFFHWVNMYWVAGKHQIQEDRKLSKSLWENFEFLYKAVCDQERKSDPDSRDLRLAEEPDRVKTLLQEEIEESDDQID